MLKSSLFDCSDACIPVTGTIKVLAQGAAAGTKVVDRNSKQVISKKCAVLTNCISEINNTLVEIAKDLYVTMATHNQGEYNNNYTKRSASLWHCHKDDPYDNITDSESFKFKSELTNNSNKLSIADIELAVPLKYLSNFWRTVEILPINCEINLTLAL